MSLPVVAQGPGFGKVVGYRMPDALVQTFYTAIKNTEDAGPIDPRDMNNALDAMHRLGETLNTQPSKRATEK